MNESKHVAIDLGAESGRIIIGTIGKDALHLEEVHRFPTGGLTVCGGLHWNIYRIYEETLIGLKKCVETTKESVVSVGVDSWGVDYTLLSSRGTPVMLPYHYRDKRTNGTEEEIESTVGRKWLYEHTGIQLLIINTLNQLIAMKRDEKDVFSIGSSILFVGDLLQYFLSGTAVTEYTIASISQLMDTRKQEWDPAIFEAFEIPATFQNRVVRAGDVIGPVRDDVCAETGLAPDVKVITPAVHDTASAAASIPAAGEDWAYISTGTWIMGGFEIQEPLINDTSFEMNISNSAGVFDTTLFLKNTMGLWLIQECKRIWNSGDFSELGYGEIVSEVEAYKSESVLIDPDDSRFLSPSNMVEEIRDAIRSRGLVAPGTNDVGKLSRIVYESLACKIKYVLDLLSVALNKEYTTIHAIGGGIKNRLLMQMLADITGATVLTGPTEAAAVGNIMMQAYGAGRFSSYTDMRQYLRRTIPIETFKPENVQVARDLYQVFLEQTGL